MTTVEHIPDTKIAEIYVRKPIEAADYKSMGSEFERLTNEHDKLDFLLTVDSVGSMSPAAIWQDLKMAPEYLGKVGRVALISDVEWYDRLAGAANVLPGLTLKHFEPEQRETALGWLAES